MRSPKILGFLALFIFADAARPGHALEPLEPLLKNGRFEEGIKHWVVRGNVVVTQPKEPSKPNRVRISGQNGEISQKITDLKIGDKYRFIADARASNPSIRAWIGAEPATSSTGKKVAVTSAQYKQYVVEFKATEETFTVYAKQDYGNSQLDVQSVRVFKITSNAALPDSYGADYPTPPGCTSFTGATSGRAFHVDPLYGSMSGDGSASRPWRTLREVVAANLIGTQPSAKVKPGDVIYLRTGDHGDVVISGYRNSKFIQVKAADGHRPRLSGLQLWNSSRWLFEGLNVSKFPASNGYPLVRNLSDSDNIIFARNDLYSARDSSSWTVSQWIQSTPTGIRTEGRCTTVVGNHVSNVRHGILLTGTDSIAQGNIVRGYSADGINPLNSRTIVRGNQILDGGFATMAEGDPNHDDAIQMYSLAGGVIRDVTVDSNFIQASTDPKRFLPDDTNQKTTGLQGIILSDGKFDRLTVTNNVIISKPWFAGLIIAGATNSLIANNTVAGGKHNGLWVSPSKEGYMPTNTVVRNNLATSFVFAKSGVKADHNVAVSDPKPFFAKFDPVRNGYDLHLKNGSPAIGRGSAEQMPARDIEGEQRRGATDVGAYAWLDD